jgi:hypothetical protein
MTLAVMRRVTMEGIAAAYSDFLANGGQRSHVMTEEG